MPEKAIVPASLSDSSMVQKPKEEVKVDDDTEPGDNSDFLPKCTKCFHQKTCYAYLSILGKQEEFKQLKWVALPYPAESLAPSCQEYKPTTDIVDKTKIDKSPDEEHT